LFGDYFLLMIRFCFGCFQLALLFALISPWETSGAANPGEFGLNYLEEFLKFASLFANPKKDFPIA